MLWGVFSFCILLTGISIVKGYNSIPSHVVKAQSPCNIPIRLKSTAWNMVVKGGFGKQSIRAKDSNAQKQLESRAADDPCICNSGSLYKNCCLPAHQGNPQTWSSLAPPEIVRGRYSAFALGEADFIIATTHKTNREYVKYRNKYLNLQKAYKAWTKDVITTNSEVFGFLKFEIIDVEEPSTVTKEPNEASTAVTAAEKAAEKEKLSLDDLQELRNGIFAGKACCTVKYRMLVRHKSSGNTIPIEEVSLFVMDDEGASLYGEVNSTGIGKKKKKGSIVEAASNADQRRWYYAAGAVGTIDEEVLKEMSKNIPKYAATDTIRDRWE